MFRILTVCTGNICRSVLAEALLRRDLPSDIFQIDSAGIMAVRQGAVPGRQLKIAKELGLHGLEFHETRMTTLDIVHASDLVLVMSRGHRSRLLRLDTSSARRTFTIREFARLAPVVTADDVEELIPKMGNPLRAAVEAVATKRGTLPPPKREEEFDVIDPYLQSRRIYRQSRDELVPAVQVTTEFLKEVVSLFGAADSVPNVEAEFPEDGVPVERCGPKANGRVSPPFVRPPLPTRASVKRRERQSSIVSLAKKTVAS